MFSLALAFASGTGAAEAQTDTTAPTFKAELTSASTVRIIFDEPVTGATTAAQWGVTDSTVSSLSETNLDSDNDLILTLAAPRPLTSFDDPDRFDDNIDGPLVALTRAGITYTPPTTGALADTAGNAFGAAGAPVVATDLDDKAPPTFTARTETTTKVNVVFTEPIDSADNLNDSRQRPSLWLVDNAVPTAVELVNTTSTVPPYANGNAAGGAEDGSDYLSVYTLTVGMAFAADHMPTVQYVRPSSNPLHDADPNPANHVETTTVTAAVGIDTTAPVLSNAQFTDANTITIDVNDRISTVPAGAFTVALDGQGTNALGTVTAAHQNFHIPDTAVITLTTVDAAAPNTEYDVIYTAAITDTAGNPAVADTLDVNSGDVVPPVLSDQQFVSATRATITVNEHIAEITAGFSAVPGLGTITATRTNNADGTATITLTSASATSDSTSYEITHPAITDLNGQVLAGGSFTIMSGDYASFRAELSSATAVKIIFEGTVTGTTAVSEWSVDGAASTAFAGGFTGALSSTAEFTLVIPERDLTDVDDSGDVPPGALAAADVVYTRPAANMIMDTDGHHLAAVGGSATATGIADGAPPTFTAITATTTEIDIIFTEWISASNNANKRLEADWTVNDVTPAEVEARNVTESVRPHVNLGNGGGVYTLYTLTAASAFGVDDTPSVRYVGNSLSDGVPNVVAITPAGAPIIAADGNPDTVARPSPTFTAQTTGTTEVTVTFSKNIYGTTAPAEWSVGAATPASVVPANPNGVRTLTLTLASGDALEPDATPVVTYTKPGSGNALSDEATGGSEVETANPTATDGIEPVFVSAEFDGATTIEIVTSEDIAVPSSGDLTVTAASDSATLTVSSPAFDADTDTLTLTVTTAADGGVYTIAGSITDTASPANTNTAATTTATYTAAPEFTARTDTVTTVVVTFDKGVYGTTAPGEWSVGSATPESVVPTNPNGVRTLTLTLATGNALETDATPVVTYTKPGSGNALSSAASGGSEVATANPTATDGIAPVFVSAEFDGATTIEIVTSEDIADPTSATFTVTPTDGSAALAVSSPVFDADTDTLTLTVAAPVDGATYTIAGSISDTASPPNTNAAASTTATYTVPTDTTAPTFSAELDSSTELRIVFTEPVDGQIDASQWSVASSAPSSIAPDPIPAGQTVSEITLTIAGRTATDLSGLSAGTITYAPPGTGGLADAADNPVAAGAASGLTDGAGPEFVSAEFASATSITIRTSEDLAVPLTAGSFTVDETDTPTNTLGVSAVPSFDAATDTITLTVDTAATEGTGYTITGSIRDTVNPANENTDAETAVTYTVPDTTSPTFRAELTSASTVRIVFDETVTGTTAAAEWSVGGVSASTVGGMTSATLAAAGELELGIPARTLTSLADYDGDGPAVALAKGNIIYARPASGTNTLADGAGNDLAAQGGTAAATALDDKAPPTFTARTVTTTTIDVVFTERIHASSNTPYQNAAHWTVDDVAPTGVAAVNTTQAARSPDGSYTRVDGTVVTAHTVYTLTTAAFAADATPSVQYTAPTSRYLADLAGADGGARINNVDDDRNNRVVQTGPVTASAGVDAAPPVLSDAKFTSASSITISVDDYIADVAGGTFTTTPSLGAITAARTNHADNTATITLTTTTAASDNTDYAIAHPAITDEAGNTLAMGTISGVNSGVVSMPTFSAELIEADKVRIVFSLPVSGTTAASEWSVGGSAPSAISETAITSPVAELVLTRAGTHTRTDLGTLTAALITYTPPSSGALADTAGNGLGAAGTAVAASGLDDKAPPTFTAITASVTNIRVLFTERLVDISSNYRVPSSWLVDGTAPSAVSGFHTSSEEPPFARDDTNGVRTLYTLVSTTDLESDSTPEIRYIRPSSRPLTDAISTVFESPLNNAVASATVTAADGRAPTFPDARFIAANVIEVSADEDITDPGDLAFTVALNTDTTMTLGAVTYTYSSATDRFVLTTADPATAGSEYRVTLPAISDTSSNEATSTSLRATYDPPGFDAELTSASTVEIEFSSPVTGTTVPADWHVDGVAATAVDELASVELSDASTIELTIPDRGSTGLADPDGDGSAGALTAASVTYTPPATGALVSAAGVGFGVAGTAAQAASISDGAPPRFEAVLTSTASVRIDFSEDVTGMTAPDEWSVAGETAVGGSTAATISGDQLVLTIPERMYTSLAAKFGDELDITAITAANVVYTRPSAGTNMLADGVGNEMAAQGASVAATDVADEAPPTFEISLVNLPSTTTPTGIFIIFSEIVESGAQDTESDWLVQGVVPDSFGGGTVNGGSPSVVDFITRTATDLDTAPAITVSSVSYTVPASGAVVDLAGNGFGNAGDVIRPTRAFDDASPVLSGAVFTAANMVEIDVTEDIAQPAAAGFEVRLTADANAVLGVTTALYSSATGKLTLTTGSNAVDSTGYTIAYPAITDEAGVAADPGTLTATSGDFTPPTFDAALVDAETVTVTFGEPISGTTAAGEWHVDGTAASAVNGLASDTLSGATSISLTLADPRATTDITTAPALSVTYTPPATGALADSASNGFGAASTPVAATALTDEAPPAFEATLTSRTSVRIDFSEAVSGTTAFGEWSVAGATATAIDSDTISDGTLVLTIPERELTGLGFRYGDETLTEITAANVVYTRPSTGTNTVADALGIDMADQGASVTATDVGDEVPPTFNIVLEDGFTDPTLLTILFSEPVVGERVQSSTDPWSIPDHNPSGGFRSFANFGGTVLLRAEFEPLRHATDLAAAPAITTSNVSYTVPASGEITDVAGNAIGAAGDVIFPLEASDEAPPTFSAELTAANTITINFSEPVDGTIDAADWAIASHPIRGISPGSAPEDAPIRTLDLTIDARTPDLATAPALTAAGITYTPPSSGALADVADNGFGEANTAVSATGLTDEVAPTFRAALTAANTITITFSEPVSGATAAGQWSAPGSTSVSVSSTALSSATSLDLGIGTRATDLATEPALAAAGITYTPPSSGALADAADNVFGDANTAVMATALTDEAPPALAAEFVPTNGPDNVSPRTVTISVSEPISDHCDMAFTVELASDRTMNLGTVTCAYDSEVFTLTTATDAADRTDYVLTHPDIADSAGNQLDSGDIALTSSDYTPPTFRAELVSSSEYRIIFDEAVSGTTSPGDWVAAGRIVAADRVGSIDPSGTFENRDEINLVLSEPRISTALVLLDGSARGPLEVVRYTSTTPLANAVGLPLGGVVNSAVDSTALADKAPPEFAARTGTSSEVDVIFSEPIRNSGALAETPYWRVDGIVPTAIAAFNVTESERPHVDMDPGDFVIYTLTVPTFRSDHMPEVQYVRPDSNHLQDDISTTRGINADNNDVVEATVTASDGAPPTLLSAELTSNSMITITPSEAIRPPGPGFSVFAGMDRDSTLGAVTPSYSASSNEIMLTTEFSIEPGMMYSIDYPEITDVNGNTAPASSPDESTPNAIRTADLGAPKVAGAEFEFQTDEFTNGKTTDFPDGATLYLVFEDMSRDFITVSDFSAFSVNGEPASSSPVLNNRLSLTSVPALTYESNTVYTVVYPDITDARGDTDDDGNAVGDADDAILPGGSVIITSPDLVPPTLGAVAFTQDRTVTVEASEPLRDPSSLVFCLEEDDTTGSPAMRDTSTGAQNSCPKADGDTADDLGAITVSQDPSDHTLTLTPEIAPRHGASYILHIPEVYDLSEAQFNYRFYDTTIPDSNDPNSGFFSDTVITQTTNIESLCNLEDTATNIYVCKDSGGLLLEESIYGAGADPALTYTDTRAPEVSEITLVTPNVLDVVFNEQILEGGAGVTVTVVQDATTRTHASIDIEEAVAPSGNLTRVTFANTAALGAGTAAITITGVQDRGSNAFPSASFNHVLNDPGTVRDSMFTVPDAVPLDMGDPFAIELAPPPGSEGLEIDLDDIDGGPDGMDADTIDPMITARIDGVGVEIPGSTTVLSFGTNNVESITILAIEPSGSYEPADTEDADEVAAAALLNGGAEPIVLVSLGNAESIQFSRYVSITLEGAAGATYVYFVDAMRTVSVIAECAEGVDADTPPSTDPRTASDPDDECYLETDEGDVVIWTNHFTDFGASNAQTAARGGDGCDDCTPPTLGVDNNGVRRVSGGFSYNGDRVDALYYYTPMPLITVNVGEENTAIIKVFEDSGVDRIRHVGLAFGLSRGQHFAQSEAEIRVDISFTGETTASVSSKHNAIDADSLSVDTQKGECMPESEAECLIVTILHTFREPLDFNVVSTVIWDDRANSWQNFFNHGIEVTGESLNPRHGIPVNDGQLVLYPIIEGHVDEDGDGIYDYDERHVTYMIDAERELYRLSHDGTYVPIRNLYGLYHEVDESMYDPTRETSHGTLREAHSFADIMAEERRIAGQIIAGMGIADPLPPAPFTPSLYAGHVEVPRAEAMAGAIEAEAAMAELIFERLYPSINDETR